MLRQPESQHTDFEDPSSIKTRVMTHLHASSPNLFQDCLQVLQANVWGLHLWNGNRQINHLHIIIWHINWLKVSFPLKGSGHTYMQVHQTCFKIVYKFYRQMSGAYMYICGMVIVKLIICTSVFGTLND